MAEYKLKKTPMTRTKRTRIVGKDGPDPIDVDVGQQVRKYRLLRGLTQTQLAERVGVKFQQMQKYESGASRVSASRLVKIAEGFGYDHTRLVRQIRGYTGTRHAV